MALSYDLPHHISGVRIPDWVKFIHSRLIKGGPNMLGNYILGFARDVEHLTGIYASQPRALGLVSQNWHSRPRLTMNYRWSKFHVIILIYHYLIHNGNYNDQLLNKLDEFVKLPLKYMKLFSKCKKVKIFLNFFISKSKLFEWGSMAQW